MEKIEVTPSQPLVSEIDEKRFLNGSLSSLKEEGLNLVERMRNTEAYLAQHGVESDKSDLYAKMKEWVGKAHVQMTKIRKEFTQLFGKIKDTDPQGPFMKDLRIDEFAVLNEDMIEESQKTGNLSEEAKNA